MNALKEWFEKWSATWAAKPFNAIRLFVGKPGESPILAQGDTTLHDPASLTKLMTFYVANRAGDAAPEAISISAHSVSFPKNKADILKLNDILPWNDALAAMMIASDNRAAAGIAEALGRGTTPSDRQHDFVMRMNATAQELGMTQTRFANANGMPLVPKRDQTTQPAQTTAADMAKLIDAIYRDFPKAAATYLEPNSVTYKGVTFSAHHGLNRPDKPSYVATDGITVGAKTGFTFKALFNLVSRVTTAQGDKLDIVLLGVPPTVIQQAQGLVERESLMNPAPPAPLKRTRAHAKAASVSQDALRDAVAQKIVRLWAESTQQDKAHLATIPTVSPVPLEAFDSTRLPLLSMPPLHADIRPAPPTLAEPVHGVPARATTMPAPPTQPQR